jgi:phosphoribosylaminoimidazole-succinocarboxamide synthase
MLSTPLIETDLPGIERVATGKVRDIYAFDDSLLIVATDRISAFDCVLPQGIPDKGRVLTRMSLFWFDYLRDIVPNHVITAEVKDYPLPLRAFRDQLDGRSMLVKRCRMAPLECVARGYLAGSGWKDYQQSGSICGIPLPSGLRESERLPEPIFTPATKAQTGHDENVPFETAEQLLGRDCAILLRDLTLRLYSKASEHAESRGIILADTKFEFGWQESQVLLADEVLTPDSSRFWPLDDYAPGRPQKSFDKQFVRDYLETLDWDKQPPAPSLPAGVIERTSEKYREAYKRLTGNTL